MSEKLGAKMLLSNSSFVLDLITNRSFCKATIHNQSFCKIADPISAFDGRF